MNNAPDRCTEVPMPERPAVKAALAKVAAIKSHRDAASEDQKDRFFNRGRYARA